MTERLKEYYIDNLTATDKIITLTKETSCGIFESVTDFEQIAPANTETKIDFPGDGIYLVYVNAILDSTAYYFKDLFESMIVYTSASLCGDIGTNCSFTTDCTGETKNYLNNALSKFILYVSVNNPRYDDALNDSIQKIRCSAVDIAGFLAMQEQYVGVSDASELLKVELAHFYMSLYAADKELTDPSDYAELDDLYNYDKLKYCIRKLGVVDCDAPAPPPGVLHTATLTVAPTTIGLGDPTNVTASYKLTANDDTFVAVIDTNIPNVDISKFNGFTYNEMITGVVSNTTYYITYSYMRGGSTYQNTITADVTAYPPQWYGGESVVADFTNVDKAYASTIESSFANTTAVYKSTSNGNSSNTNTTNKYIWWITKNPIKFYIGSFEIITGAWSGTCDPNAYAIIHKTINTVMEDGVTEQVLHYYRTCPLQNLSGQTLTYELKQ